MEKISGYGEQHKIDPIDAEIIQSLESNTRI